MQQLGARLEIDQGGHRLAISTRAGQHGHRHRINTAIGAKGDKGIHRSAFESAVQTVTRFESKAARVMAVSIAGAHPAFFGDNNGDGLVDHFDFGYRFFLFLNQRATGVGKGLGVRLNFFDDQAAQSGGVAYDLFELGFFFAEFFEFLLDLDRFQARQLAQANF